MNSIAREKFFSGSAPQRIWMSAILVCFGVMVDRALHLFHGSRRDDVDLRDHHALDWFAHCAVGPFNRLRVADLFQNIVTFDQFAERRVLMIEPVDWRETNEKLATR